MHPEESKSGPAQILAAVAIMVIFAGFAFYVAAEAKATEDDSERWSRLLTIFSSIEALGFAAAGLLLGQSVAAPARTALRASEDARRIEQDSAAARTETMRAEFAAIAGDLDHVRAALGVRRGEETETEIAELDRAIARARSMAERSAP